MADEDPISATAEGLVRCLRMLTDEAASLNLQHTFAALQDAIATCRLEMNGALPDMHADTGMAPALLH